VVLTTPAGAAMGQELLKYAGEPVRVSGELGQRGRQLVLRADPARIVPAGR
jgi:hypothetical protein